MAGGGPGAPAGLVIEPRRCSVGWRGGCRHCRRCTAASKPGEDLCPGDGYVAARLSDVVASSCEVAQQRFETEIAALDVVLPVTHGQLG
jgi:hypothetical protein